MAKNILINLDDLGMHPTINEAIGTILSQGIIHSSSLLATGNFFDDAVHTLKELFINRVGVHLTLTSEYPKLPMTPLTRGHSLVQSQGHFRRVCPTVNDQLNLEEVEEELRSQILRVQKANLEISHLDGHMFFYEEWVYGNSDLLQLVSKLASELKVPFRNSRKQNLKTYFIWNGYETVPSRIEYYKALFSAKEILEGELILHPAKSEPLMRDFSGSGTRRVADYLYFSSSEFINLVRENQVEIVDWTTRQAN